MKVRILVFAVLLILIIIIASECLSQSYDALVRQAEAKIAAKQWEEALSLYERAFKTGEYNYSDYYNAACACSHLGKTEDAYSYLLKAIEAGFLDIELLKSDPDLDAVRKTDRWKSILDSVGRKVKEVEKSFPEKRPAGEVINLPPPNYIGKISVEEALKNRRSVRTYKDRPLSLEEVSQLLWAAYGVTKSFEHMPDFLRGGFRTAPSAGALYPLELYLAAFKVTDLKTGIYWYDSEKHKLVRIADGDKRREVSAAAFDQDQFRSAAAAIVYSAVFSRTTGKYGRRGRERYVCMDLGHSAENVYLQAYALGIGTCAVGAFDDLRLKKAIGMTRDEEPLYIMPIGKVE